MEAVAKLFSQLVESLPALLIVLAVGFLALGLAGGVTYHAFLPMPDTAPRLIAGLAAVALLGLAVYLMRASATGAVPKPDRYGVAITSPVEGSHIGVVTVAGTIKAKLPPGYTLEILRMYPAGGFIPMGKADPDYGAGTWRASGCNIGGKAGDARIIGAYLVGPSGRTLFDYYAQANEVVKFARTLAQKEDIYLPALKPTADMVECARVGVVRQ